MEVVTLEASDISSSCKDFLTVEWSNYKKSGQCKVRKVCRYLVGGHRGNPAAVVDSVASGIQEFELLLKDVIDSKVMFLPTYDVLSTFLFDDLIIFVYFCILSY